MGREEWNARRHPVESEPTEDELVPTQSVLEPKPPSDSIVLGSWMDEATYKQQLKLLEARGIISRERDPRDEAFLKRMFPNL